MRTRPAAVAAAALLALAPAATASAADAHPVPAGLLTLTVSGAGDTWIRGVTLRCSPAAGGSHPEARAACDSLTWARGDLDTLPGDPHMCTKQYAPVTATAQGIWRGRAVHWRKTFANACTLDTKTGAVFRF